MRRALAILAVLTLLAAACGGDDEAEAPSEPILVLGAASLTDAFTDIAAEFEAANEGVTVELSFGASSALATQIIEGAPASVFASASGTQMTAVVDEGLNDSEPVIFATNVLEIAVSTEAEGEVTTIDDFANEELLLGLCAEDVPCGTFAVEMFDNAGITPSIDTFEPDVRALLGKVESAELDAGIVYHSDVVGLRRRRGRGRDPRGPERVASYPIATLTEATDAEWAQAFVDFVMSDTGQEILQGYGFSAP